MQLKAVDSCFAEPVPTGAAEKHKPPNCPSLGQEVELVIEARGSGGSERARGKS